MILTNKQCEKLLRELSQDEYEVTERQKRLAVRNVTMARLMLFAGLRTSEVVNLVRGDLMVTGSPVNRPMEVLHIVRGVPKGHSSRKIRVGENLTFWFEMMDECWWKPDAEKPGYFAFYGVSPLKRITAKQFRRIVSKAAIDALGFSVKPNSLRRTCAARLLRETDRRTVQRLLGYKTDQDSFYF